MLFEPMETVPSDTREVEKTEAPPFTVKLAKVTPIWLTRVLVPREPALSTISWLAVALLADKKIVPAPPLFAPVPPCAEMVPVNRFVL